MPQVEDGGDPVGREQAGLDQALEPFADLGMVEVDAIGGVHVVEPELQRGIALLEAARGGEGDGGALLGREAAAEGERGDGAGIHRRHRRWRLGSDRLDDLDRVHAAGAPDRLDQRRGRGRGDADGEGVLLPGGGEVGDGGGDGVLAAALVDEGTIDAHVRLRRR
jgi:hypothetical protein